jgi:hypothetical protein
MLLSALISALNGATAKLLSDHIDTFKNATKIANYNDIPESWGGPEGVADPCD